MKTHSIKNIVMIILLCFSSIGFGQRISFTLEIDKDTVSVGDMVSVTYTLSGARGDFQEPEFSDLRLVGGPNYSSSISIVNGVMDQRFTYNYVFQLVSPGDFVVPSAAVMADGERYESPTTVIHATENKDWNPSDKAPKVPIDRNAKKKKNVTQI